MDGYQALKAFLPPTERRGLVLVDSSFDRSREFDRLTQGLVEAYKRWATGIYAFWYPLMEPHAVRAFERGIVATGIRKILKIDLSVLPQKWTASLPRELGRRIEIVPSVAHRCRRSRAI
jgi:23S rRNA (adenine2030-N6)-methyltransferase